MRRNNDTGEKMAWLYIILAGLLETTWPFVLKRVAINAWAPAVLAIVISVPVFYLLNLAMKSIPTGTVYLTFVGIGSIGVALVGIFLFHESTNVLRLVSLVLIIAGVIGLKYFETPRPDFHLPNTHQTSDSLDSR
jgi:quaternary ammonium compound-resistance protein SugE